MDGQNSTKLRVDIPIAVEGKYDKIKLCSIIDANIVTTDGFGIFSSAEKTALIRRIAEPRGIIVLTDSDGAGLVIRNYFRSILPKDKLIHLYTPEIAGKERRKRAPSKAGFLGVEGMEAEMLRKLFEPFAVNSDNSYNIFTNKQQVTKADFFADGLSGGEGSVERRNRLAAALGLPSGLSANALLAAVNMLCSRDEYTRIVNNDC